MHSYPTRSIDRQGLFLVAEMRFDGAPAAARVTVRNISPGGLMAERDMQVKRGQRVAVELGSAGTVPGVVVWVRAPRFGIAFEREIDPRLARGPAAG